MHLQTILAFFITLQIFPNHNTLPQLPLLNLFSGDLGNFLSKVGNSLYGPKIQDVQKDREIEEYDFIIIGAGTAGSILANRLTESPDWKVLLLEAGNPENPIGEIPRIVPALQLTQYNWRYQTVPQESGCLGMIDEKCNVPVGKGIGGSSILSNNIYSRGARKDYDLWSEEMQDADWSFENTLQYHKKAEDVHLEAFDWDFHGLGGPQPVEDLKNPSRIRKSILNAAKELNYTTIDYNGKNQIGFSRPQMMTKKSRRHSVSKGYLEGIRDRKNLFIKSLSNVTKIVIDPESKEVEGVEYVRNGKRCLARNRKDVILAAGAVNSPKLLMLSGIGPKYHLDEIGIKCLVDLSVGENLRDHPVFMGLLFVLDTYQKIEDQNYLLDLYEWFVKGRGHLTTTTTDVLGKINSGNEDEDLNVEFSFVPMDLSEGYDLMGQLTNFKRETYDSIWKELEDQEFFTLAIALTRPKSSGSIRLRSKHVEDHPLIDPQYFSDPDDVEILLEAIKRALELAETDSFEALGADIHENKVYGCETHDFNTDAYWRCAIPRLQTSSFHYSGTNKMGKEGDRGTVVDHRLRVMGVKKLRVVDASVIPVAVTGHTQGVVMMLGEKAGDIIKDDWNYA